MTETVQKETGHADVIANGPGTARQVPEGEGDKLAHGRKGWVNGQPVENVDRTTEGSKAPTAASDRGAVPENGPQPASGQTDTQATDTANAQAAADQRL